MIAGGVVAMEAVALAVGEDGGGVTAREVGVGNAEGGMVGLLVTVEIGLETGGCVDLAKAILAKAIKPTPPAISIHNGGCRFEDFSKATVFN